MTQQPPTQPHYNGWKIYDEVWETMPPLPGSTPGREHLRCNVMKRMLRLGQKDEITADIDKAIAELEKLKAYYR